MTIQNDSVKKDKVLDEIVSITAGFPLEMQYSMLLMVRGMNYMRSCLGTRNADGQ